MLIRFAVDPDAIDADANDLSVSIAVHRRLLKEWRKYGMLVHGFGPLKESAVFSQVNKLPQECRRLWKVAIQNSRRRAASSEWNGYFPNDDLSDLEPFAKDFDLALLESSRAVVVGGVGIHDSSRIDARLHGLEICKIHSVSESQRFIRADEVAKRPLPKGADCRNEWNERYGEYVEHAAHVVVVDRYIYANQMRRTIAGENSGLDRVLSSCFKRSRERPVNVAILCALQHPGPSVTVAEQGAIETFVHELEKRYCGGGIRSIEFYICTDRDFASHTHERYLRTDYSVFGIDGGIDVFGGDFSHKGSVVWRHDNAETTRFTLNEAALKLSSFFHKTLL
ncbi:MAG: hypothetical protein V4723_03055 [Pseudomonadota bacterium]